MEATPRISLLAAALLLMPAAAFSWGPEGHDAVTDIAQTLISPRTQAGIAGILGPNTSITDIANIADDVRYQDTPVLNYTLAQDSLASPWHFINIPISASLSQTPTTAELDQYQDCNQQASGPTAQLLGDSAPDCIQEQIKFAVSRLNEPAPDARAPGSPQAIALWQKRRVVALAYLVHLVGDTHQPMHVTVSDNDMGGNVEKVNFQGAVKRLHELWDDLIQAASWQTQTPGQASALAQQLIAQIKALPADEVSSWISQDAETTINTAIGESFNISKNTIYPEYYQLRQSQPGHDPVVLPDDYQARMQPIVFKRLQKAGVRLAHILNQINWDGQAAGE